MQKYTIKQESLANAKVRARQRCSSTSPPVPFYAPVHGNRRENLHTPYIFGNYIHWASFLSLTLWVHFHLFSRCCLPKSELAPNSATICIYSSSRSSKVINFGTNGKRTYQFLLLINSNYGPVLHRFRDTATYWLKIAYFSYPCLIWRARSLVPFGILRRGSPW